MPIRHFPSTGVSGGSTTITPGWASGVGAESGNDRTYLIVTNKPETVTPDTPSGFTQVATSTVGSGTAGVNTGPQRITVFQKDSTAAESGNLTVTATGTNVMLGVLQSFRKESYDTWVTPTFIFGSDTTNGTAFSATTTSTDFEAGDTLCGVVATSHQTPGTNWDEHLTADSGVSITRVQEGVSGASASGNGAFMGSFMAPVRGNSANATVPLTLAFTATNATTGGLLVIRMRVTTDRNAAPGGALLQVGYGDANSGTSVTIALPTAIPANPDSRIVMAAHGDKSVGAWTPPTGFTTIQEHVGTSVSGWLGERSAVAGDKSFALGKTSSTPPFGAAIMEFKGLGAASVSAEANNGESSPPNTLKVPSVTASGASRAISMAAVDTGSGTEASVDSSMEYLFAGQVNNNPGVVIADKVLANGEALSPTWTWRADQMWAATAVFPVVVATPTLVGTWVGHTTATTARILSDTNNATSVHIAYSVNADMSGASTTTALTANAQGHAIHELSGLTADTPYHYRVVADGTTLAGGTFRTMPTSANGLRVAFASCWKHTNTLDPLTFDRIVARNADLYITPGDFQYGDVNSTDPALYHAAYDTLMGDSARARAMLASTPSYYTWSDHDFCGNASHGGSTGAATAESVYKSRVPAGTMPATGIYETWTVGRVRFIKLDCRSFKTIDTATDDANKHMLGATQEAWVEDTIVNSTEPLIFLISDVPWAYTAAGATNVGDSWGAYNTARTRLAGRFDAILGTRKVVILSGDQHCIAVDDGTNGLGYTNWSAAPVANTNSVKGGPYSHGTFSAHTQQYGIIDLADDGSTVTATFTGYRADTDASLVTHSVSASLPVPTATLTGSYAYVGSATGRTPVLLIDGNRLDIDRQSMESANLASGSGTPWNDNWGDSPATAGPTSDSYDGIQALLLTSTSATPAPMQRFSGSNAATTPGETLVLTAWMKPSRDMHVQIGVDFYTTPGSYLSGFYPSWQWITGGVWTKVSETFTVPANGNYTQPWVNGQEATTGDTLKVDRVYLGPPVPSATLSGSYSYSGTATGKRTPKASLGGSYAYAGSATGKRTAKANLTGSYAYTGTATGKRTAVASLTGSWLYAGSATGKRTAKASLAGSYAYAGSATGKRTAVASLAGSYAYTGSATGKRTAKASLTGSYAYVGTATVQGSIPSASLVGEYSFTGAATGRRSPKGVVTGTHSWSGTRTGKRRPVAARIGLYTFTGSMRGKTRPVATASGQYVYTGTAIGFVVSLDLDVTVTGPYSRKLSSHGPSSRDLSTTGPLSRGITTTGPRS